MVELRLIRNALALARHRSFARAAESLHLTQPSLSRSIASLESQLGVKLFDRAKDGARPTAFGELLLQRGRALLHDEAEFRREITLLAGLEAGKLRIGAGPYPAEISVGAAAGRLLRRHPGLSIEIVCASAEAVAQRLAGGEFDAGVFDVGALGNATPLRAEPLPPHPTYLAVRPGHPLAGRRTLTRDEVAAFPIATGLLTGRTAAMAEDARIRGEADRTRGIFVPPVLVNALAVARQIAEGSDALFPATAGMLAPYEAMGTLVRLPYIEPGQQTYYGIVTRVDRTMAPATVAFLDELRAVEAQIYAQESAAPAALAKRRPARPVTA